mmetsp:Transcript_10647/g.17761  ORF Transcript_10647/g.17761 Transcript_10647/m.17761 type:complete len:136 (+) Transcript_10647:60-467(+)
MNDLKFLEDGYFGDLDFKRTDSFAASASRMAVMGGEMFMLVLIFIPMMFMSFGMGLARGMMPMVVIFVNVWRMWMRPTLKVLSDICWACTRNLTIVHHRNDLTGANLPLDAILAVQPDIDFSKSAQNAYESTPIA